MPGVLDVCDDLIDDAEEKHGGGCMFAPTDTSMPAPLPTCDFTFKVAPMSSGPTCVSESLLEPYMDKNIPRSSSKHTLIDSTAPTQNPSPQKKRTHVVADTSIPLPRFTSHPPSSDLVDDSIYDEDDDPPPLSSVDESDDEDGYSDSQSKVGGADDQSDEEEADDEEHMVKTHNVSTAEPAMKANISSPA